MTLAVLIAAIIGALGMGALIGAMVVRRAASILSPDGRRAWAFAAICGGCAVFTGFAAVGVWLVSGNQTYTFYLALAAHGQVFVGMTALGWAMGRRLQAEAGQGGVKINDQEQPSATATVTATVQTTPAAPAPAPGGEGG